MEAILEAVKSAKDNMVGGFPRKGPEVMKINILTIGIGEAENYFEVVIGVYSNEEKLELGKKEFEAELFDYRKKYSTGYDVLDDKKLEGKKCDAIAWLIDEEIVFFNTLTIVTNLIVSYETSLKAWRPYAPK